MKVSAVLIVKNEEDCLERCLEALNQIADEIIVVDTGSDDSSRDIALRFTKKVFDYPWGEDFAAAKNYAVSRASGDFVLVVDADEVLREPGTAAQRLRTFVRNCPQGTAGIVDVVSPIGTGRDALEVVDKQPRLFRPAEYRYVGAVHEQLEAFSGAIKVRTTGLVLDHSGYATDVVTSKDKFARNQAILQKELETASDDEYILFQLGKSHFCARDYASAAEYLERAMKAIDFDAEPRPVGKKGPVATATLTDLPVSLAYAYCNTNRVETAKTLLESHAAMGHPGTIAPDFPHALGYVYLMLGDIEKSRAAYEESLVRGAEDEQVLGTGSYASLYHLGLLAEADKDIGHALRYYLDALQEKNDYYPVLARCVDIIVEYGAALPPEIVDVAEPSALTSVFLERLTDHVTQGRTEAAKALLQGAAAVSPGLLQACRQQLERLRAGGSA